MTIHRNIHQRDGQAMIEFCIGLIAVMVIVAALVQLVLLATAHNRTLSAARTAAGHTAMIDVGSAFDSQGNPEFVRTWLPGPDEKRYTPDDAPETGNAAGFDREVTGHAAEDAAEWAILDTVPGNRLTLLRGAAAPQMLFGLVKGEESESVDVLSTVRSLFYDAETVEVKSTVWMTRMKGLY